MLLAQRQQHQRRFRNGYAYTNDQRGLGSITGRVGYTWGPALLYVKGGYAYSDNSETLTLGGVPQAFGFDHGHRDGYTVGAGLEYMFAQNWSGKVEYQYYDFGDSQFVTPAVLAPFGSFRNDEHTVKVGINYRFNLGAARWLRSTDASGFALRKRPAQRRPFLLALPKKRRPAAGVPDLVNRVPRYCRRVHLQVAAWG